MSLRARNLGRRLGGRWAVRGCSLDLPPGTWLCVLGPNGAGKTTLLRLLATVLAPDEGVLYWQGVAVGQGAALRGRLGYLPESFALPALPTVGDGLAYLAALKGIGPGLAGAACARALRWAGVASAAGERSDHLSAGTLRSVGLAQAVLGDPAVLLLDEPAVGLDPQRRRALCRRLRALAADRCVIVTATHEADLGEEADAVALLDGGRMEGPFPVGAFRDTLAAAAGRGSRAGASAGAGATVTLAGAYALWRQGKSGAAPRSG